MKKRILSLLLTLVMILGMIPATTLTASAATLPEITGLHRGVLANHENTNYVYWDAVEGAIQYTVKVYRDGTLDDETTYYADDFDMDKPNASFSTGLTPVVSGIDNYYYIAAGTYKVQVTAIEKYGSIYTESASSEISFTIKEKEQVIYDVTASEMFVIGVEPGEAVKMPVGKAPFIDFGTAITKKMLEEANYEVAYVEGVDWLTSSWNEDGELELTGTVPENCPNGTYTAYVGLKHKDSNTGFVIECKVEVSGYTYISEIVFNTPNVIPTYWQIYDPSTDLVKSAPSELTIDTATSSSTHTDWNNYIRYIKQSSDDTAFSNSIIKYSASGTATNITGDVHTFTTGKYAIVWDVPVQREAPNGDKLYFADDVKAYVGSKDNPVDVIEDLYGNNVYLVFTKYYYVYDEKPEIHSVSVNGTSVADGASYNSNSKNVTVKTTYDSTLSAAMLEYGCTSVKKFSQWYLNGEKLNIAATTPVDNGNGTSSDTYYRTLNDGDVLEIRNWLEVKWPDGTTDIVDEHTMTVTGPISEVNVGATWSGTPANATSNTDGITVTGTQWYRQNGNTWTALTSSDTIKEGYTYRCEVTVAATDGYTLADGYTVKINGTAATKKSGNTWYRDVTITGISDYVDVDEIGVPEAYTNPVFTYDTSDVAPSRKHWDVVQVEWVECDKDGKVLSDALTENDVFKKDTYYRVEVTVVPETNWQFHGSDLGFYINGKAANYLYGYNKAYADSVTGYLVYNTADIEGTYTLYVYDNSLTGSAKDILIEDGQYLGSDATAPTTTQPASGGYAYYKNGVLLLNNYNNEDAHFVFEEGMLDLYLKGDNTIGAICDHSYLNVGSALDGYRDGSLTIDGEETASLFVAGDALDAYCSIFVQNELYINGGDITVTLGENANAVYAGGGVTVADDYTVYVNSTGNDFAAAHKWDGSVSLDKYHTVWFKDLKHQFTTQPTGGIVATGDTHTVSWKTNFTPEQIIVEAWKSSGGSYKASREYYSGTTTSVELPALSSGGHYYIIAVYDDGSVTSDVVYVTEVQAITDVTLSVVDPVAGKNPSFTVTLPQDAPYEHAVNEAFWIDRTDSSKALTETDTFVAGHEYIVTVRLKAKDGYRFLTDVSAITVNVGNTQDFIKRLVINENEYLEVVFVLTATEGSVSVTGSATDGIKVKVEKLSGSATLIVAQYEGGKMVGVEMQTITGSNTYTMNQLTHKNGCTYKAFLVNSTTYAPLCAADDF